MEKLNYFDVLKLNSDDKDKDIAEAIEKFSNNIKARQGGQNISPEEMKEALALLEKMKVWATNKEEVIKEENKICPVGSALIFAFPTGLLFLCHL